MDINDGIMALVTIAAIAVGVVTYIYLQGGRMWDYFIGFLAMATISTAVVTWAIIIVACMNVLFLNDTIGVLKIIEILKEGGA